MNYMCHFACGQDVINNLKIQRLKNLYSFFIGLSCHIVCFCVFIKTGKRSFEFLGLLILEFLFKIVTFF
jgi:hypothetical protein